MDIIFDKLLTFILILTRLSAFLMVLPVFGYRAIPVRIKASLAILLSVFFSTLYSFTPPQAGITQFQGFLLIINECIIGAGMGIVIAIIFATVRLTANIIEQQAGLTLSEVLDPLTGTNSQPLASLMEMLFILLLLSANGHHGFLLILNKSFQVVPMASTPHISSIAEAIIASGSEMFRASLRLAGPLLAVFLIMMVLLAIFARIVPEMDILFISLPVKAGVALIMVTISLPFLEGFVSDFYTLIQKLVPL